MALLPVHRKFTPLVLMLLIFTLTEVPLSAHDNLNQAHNYVFQGQRDWAFLEYLSFLRHNPDDPLAAEATFAVAEYEFLQNNYAKSRQLFDRLNTKNLGDWTEAIKTVYLEKCCLGMHLRKDAQYYRKQSLDILFSKQGLFLFNDVKRKLWVSPLGTHFEIREYVDHLEILADGNDFQIIRH